MTTQSQECPWCNGTGRRVMQEKLTGAISHIPCDHCDGTGQQQFVEGSKKWRKKVTKEDGTEVTQGVLLEYHPGVIRNHAARRHDKLQKRREARRKARKERRKRKGK